MCIAYLSLGVHTAWPVIIAANRDEYHDRPALPARPWADAPHVIAGRDLEAGGTWLGTSAGRRWALLTNFRDPSAHRSDMKTRGRLVADFLIGCDSPRDYAHGVFAQARDYNGFNLVVGENSQAWYVGNHAACTGPAELKPGRYALSNHALDTPWPKVERLRSRLDACIQQNDECPLAKIYEVLRDRTRAEDHILPQTGVTLEMERLLSSIFIVSPRYGTRCSTIVALDGHGGGVLSETSYDREGTPIERHDWPLGLTASHQCNVGGTRSS